MHYSVGYVCQSPDVVISSPQSAAAAAAANAVSATLYVRLFTSSLSVTEVCNVGLVIRRSDL